MQEMPLLCADMGTWCLYHTPELTCLQQKCFSSFSGVTQALLGLALLLQAACVPVKINHSLQPLQVRGLYWGLLWPGCGWHTHPVFLFAAWRQSNTHTQTRTRAHIANDVRHTNTRTLCVENFHKG